MKGFTPPPRFSSNLPAEPLPITRTITITEGISVKDLAEKLEVRAKDIIARLLQRGVLATVNQTLDADLAKEMARLFGADAGIISFEEQMAKEMEATVGSSDGLEAGAISRPSTAVVTLQALARRYFAISVRVSRSSSTTRMLGDGWAMPTFVGDSGQAAKDFCFAMFLRPPPQQGATRKRPAEKVSLRWLILPSSGLERTFLHELSGSHHDLNLGGLCQYLPIASSEAAG